MNKKIQNAFYIHENSNAKIKPGSLIESLSQLYNPPKRQYTLTNDDLYNCLRIFLCFGRIIGIVPISGLFKRNLISTRFRVKSLAGLTSALIIALLVLNDGLALVAFLQAPAEDANKIAKNISGFVCYSIGLYVFIFMYRNSAKLIDCFYKWREVQTVFYKEDRTLFRSVTLISGVIFTSAITENLVSHWKHFKGAFITSTSIKNNSSVSSVWEGYYEESQFSQIVPYNMIIAILIFLCNKWSVYAWNFGDILISVIARAVYKRFQLHLDSLREEMENNTAITLDGATWNQAVKDHQNLLELLHEFGNLLSPLIFACTATNIYFICLTLNSFLVPSDEDVVNNVYTAWAFVHLLTRTYTAIFCCAKVNEHVHKIEATLSKCPISVLTKEVERAELKLRTSCIGFGGLECFIITKPFILSVFSVIFTFEIVLLQSTMAPAPAPAKNPEIK